RLRIPRWCRQRAWRSKLQRPHIARAEPQVRLGRVCAVFVGDELHVEPAAAQLGLTSEGPGTGPLRRPALERLELAGRAQPASTEGAQERASRRVALFARVQLLLREADAQGGFARLVQAAHAQIDVDDAPRAGLRAIAREQL